MKNRIFILVAAFLAYSAIAGCDQISNMMNPKKAEAPKQAEAPVAQVQGTPIARVNGQTITLEELNREIDAFNAVVPADRPEMKITTRDQKLDYLKNQMVQRSLLAQEAMRRGIDRNPIVVQALEKTKQDLLIMEFVREEAEKVNVSSQEIEDYYNTYKDQLKEPEERQIKEIAVPTEQAAKDILIQLLQGADFSTLARERSKAATASGGGNLGFVKPGDKSPQFDAVAFSDTLEVGGVSNIFKGADGDYYILKLESKKGGQQKSLTEMWDDIKRGLVFVKQQQRIDELITKLSQNSKIEYMEAEIK